ncbi:MAG: tetratricopeptide repeat protein [Pseudomonadales bacterium]|nr:tetratricopeptide repeat protein [Pseudomonadales bacterium]
MKKIVRVSLYCILSSLMVGCGLFSDKGTIGRLQKVEKDKTDLSFKNLNHKKVRKEYQELLDLVDDDYLKEQIKRRVAEVYMIESDENQTKLSAKPSKSYYTEAIKSYSDILEKYPNSPDNAEVLYQLAKAYDMEGQQDDALLMLKQLTSRHSKYPHIAEVYFRMGDIYFNNSKYSEANKAYKAVTDYKIKKLIINAHYMLGWSQYKQGDYYASLASFSVALAELVEKSRREGSLNNVEKPLVKDTLHSMTLALVNIGGAEEIRSIKRLKKKDFIWMVYEDLGDFYLEKERYEDSANTYRMFVTGHTASPMAHKLHSKLINAYIKGGFPQQALPEKQRFIEYYGLHSRFNGKGKGIDSIREEVKGDLKQYIDELAKHYHHEGQVGQKALAKIKPKKGAKKLSKKQTKKYRKLDQKMIAQFGKAAQFYQEYVETFPKDPMVADITYLEAEAEYAARLYDKAIINYEKVAYKLASSKKAKGKSKSKAGKKSHRKADAGYAAILSYRSYVKALKEKLSDDHSSVKKVQQKAVESMLRFAKHFHQDKRSTAVLTSAAEYLFGLDQYDKAIKVSVALMNSNKALDKTLRKTALGIVAHSYFKQEKYSDAEDHYKKQRLLVAPNGKEYRQITERLAAAIYKKTEIMIAGGQKLEAVEQLLSLKSIAPKSPTRVTAQFDAATLLLELKLWARAITELEALKRGYPKHKLAVEFPRKLAFAYEKTENWPKAAMHYLGLYKNDPDKAIQQDALFLSAGYFEKDGQYENAITHFKQYAHQYELPFDNRMEARHQLALIYKKTNDKTRHLYWLRRIIDGDKKGGDLRTERSRWLGAWANIQYGDYFAWEFNRRKLRQPLAKSLPKKNKLLQDATTRYEKAASYRILEFVTMASYKIGGLYERFAKDLFQSPKPAGLSQSDSQLYASIIQEQADPFLSLAADIHLGNIGRAWDGEYNQWIGQSFGAMSRLSPARYGKSEMEANYGDEIL